MESLEATALTIVSGIILPMAVVVLLCFLPALIELKRPQDAGPKLIHPALKTVFVVESLKLVDAETTLSTIKPLQRGSAIFPVALTNLEA